MTPVATDPERARSPFERTRARQATSALMLDYCTFVDDYRIDEVGSLFTADATVDYGPFNERSLFEREAIEQFLTRLIHRDVTLHRLTNVQINFDGHRRARVVSYLHAWHLRREDQPETEVYGRYEDVTVRSRGGWHISERRPVPLAQRGFSIELTRRTRCGAG